MLIPTPTLPISLPKNAALTLSKVSSLVAIDPITGNPVGEETLEVGASLTWNSKQGRNLELPGIDMSDSMLIGYLVEPSILPDGYSLTGTVPMNLTKPSGNVEVGEFTFEQVDSPFSAAIAQVAGTAISGYFRKVDGA